jgi:hypothetical protein
VREFNGVLHLIKLDEHPEEMKKSRSFFGAIESGAKMADNAAKLLGVGKTRSSYHRLKVATWVMGITKAFTGLFALHHLRGLSASAVGVGAYQNISNAATKQTILILFGSQ